MFIVVGGPQTAGWESNRPKVEDELPAA